MKILVLNCGSSSIKYQLLEMDPERLLARGLIQKIGFHDSSIDHENLALNVKTTHNIEIWDHQTGINQLLSLLTRPPQPILQSLEEIGGVGHRVVHGGEKFPVSVLIDTPVIDEIRRCIRFAPLHNPPNLKGILAIRALLPQIPQVGVFDTSFHQTLPPCAYLYPLPKKFFEKERIRRYGFHGTSHRFIAARTAHLLGKPMTELKIISLHLGNGCSASAIDRGQSIDTSMGYTPLEGLVMGTRCGDIDPAVILHIMKSHELTLLETENLLNKYSGLLGLSGISGDVRGLIKQYELADPGARMAIEVYCYRIKKYVGSYFAVLNGADAVVFTGGVGENSALIRGLSLASLDFLGIRVDKTANDGANRGFEGAISPPDSRVAVLVVPTNEELVIARDAHQILTGKP